MYESGTTCGPVTADELGAIFAGWIVSQPARGYGKTRLTIGHLMGEGCSISKIKSVISYSFGAKTGHTFKRSLRYEKVICYPLATWLLFRLVWLNSTNAGIDVES